MDIIIKTWFETGLGDFYACLMSAKIAYDKLSDMGFNVKLILTYHRCHYGCENQKKLIDECFNLSCFKFFGINEDIPENFKLYKNCSAAFEIYVSDAEIIKKIGNINFYGYSVEGIMKGVPYPDDFYRNNIILLNDNFIRELYKYYEKIGKFVTVFYRYADGKDYNDIDFDKIKKEISKISTVNKNCKILLSCKINELNDIKIDGVEIINIDQIIDDNIIKFKKDFINMCIFMFSEKIYYRHYHWSNYPTFSFLHTKNKKKYTDFLINIDESVDFFFDDLIDIKYVFCTIAIGDRYFEKACNFAKKLNEVSKSHSVVIVSDLEHDKIDNCEIIKLPESEKTKIGYIFNYNLKYFPIKICSEKEFDYVIYVDADWEIYENFKEEKILKFLNEINKTKYDFVFERPHFIVAKNEINTCFWKHKIEPYKLMETDKYDHGHVCNEQFLVFKNNDKLKIFVEEWSKRNLICIENSVNPFAEGLEIGMSAIDANMEWTWGYLNIMSSCFVFTSNNGISYSRF